MRRLGVTISILLVVGMLMAGEARVSVMPGRVVPEPRPIPGWPLDARGRPVRILFVSRQPAADADRGAVPGLGPHHRSIVTGGRLMLADGVREPREFVPGDPARSFDVSDPSISPDGRRIAWATTTGPGDGWRIRTYQIHGGAIGYHWPDLGWDSAFDNLDPCWLDDSTLAFASTRDGGRSQYDATPVTQLWRYEFTTGWRQRLTAERNGAEEPSVDPRSGRLVYSRWWFNRARPDSAPGDTVNFWQAISIEPDGSDPRALGVGAGEARRSSLYQVALAPDGALFGVTGDALGLSPAPGACEVTFRAQPFAAPRHLAGARFDPEDAPRYGSTRGLASPSACSPALLPDGRVLFSLDPGGRGDYGLWIADRDGSNARPLIDLPGTLELDAAIWPREPARSWRRRPVVYHESRWSPKLTPTGFPADLENWPQRFRFLNRNVFGAGFGAREAVEARAAGPVKIRFWAALPRADAPHGDTLVLVREAPVSPRGRVDERDLPAGIPMFEQLVDARGRVLRSAHGPAHVAGYNAGLPGRTSSCVGCHRGHSTAR